MHLELESSKSELQTAKARESELQAQINNLKLHVARNQRDVEALAGMKSSLAEAQTQVDQFANRLKEAELRGALAAHLEAELAKARAELTDARARENDVAALLQNTQTTESNFENLRVELISAHQALSDAANREETLQIQLAEAHGAITIARQIESELEQHRAELKTAKDRIAALNSEIAKARTDTENSGEQARSAETSAILLRNEALQQELAALQTSREHDEARIRELQAASSLANVEIQRQAQTFQALQSNLQETEFKLSQATSENTSLRSQLASATESSTHHIALLSQELADLRTRASRIPELEGEVARVHAELSIALEREKALHQDAGELVSTRQKLSEIDAALSATQVALLAAQQSERDLEAQLQSALEHRARAEALESELSKIRHEHASSLATVAQLRHELAQAQESAHQAQTLRAEVSAQLITLREAGVRRQKLETRIQELETELARIQNDKTSQEAVLQAEVERLTESEKAAHYEITSYSQQLDQLRATITDLEHTAMQQRIEAERNVSGLESKLTHAVQSHSNEVSGLRAQMAALSAESQAAAESIAQKLTTARTREQELVAEIDRLRADHTASSAASQQKIEALERSITESLATSEAKDASHATELTALKARTTAELETVRLEVAAREASIAALTEQLARAESDAGKVPQLEQEIAELREKLDQSKTKEDELTGKLAAIERAAVDITTLLPKISYGPDYQIRHHSTPAVPGFAREASGPYRAPRILQWIGSHPKQTLVALCLALAAAAAGGYFLYKPSYRGLIDAPVKQLLSPVSGTVLVAEGEAGMSVTKGQPLFTIKNVNDGREQVQDAKEQTVALEEEIKYLETVRASLLQRQITQGITTPSDWISNPAIPLTEKWDTQNTDLPDSPDFNAAPPEDYFAPRIADINAKLATATAALETSKATLAAAEEAFRQNEKAEVTSPAAGAIQTMRAAQGSTVEIDWPLAEIVSSEEAFIEAAIPARLAESAVGRKVTVTLEGSNRVFDGEIVAVGPDSGWNSKQTAVSLSDIKPGYVIADVWIAQKDWAGETGFASQIGRKAKVTLN